MSMSELTVSADRKRWLAAQRKDKMLVKAAKSAILILFLVFWEFAARYELIDPFITSSPSRFSASIYGLLSKGELLEHLFVTTLEAVAGFICGTLLGTIVAVALWSSDFLSRVMEPYLVILNALPKIALGPIFIVWIGAGPAAIVVIAVTVSVVVTVLEVLNGFRSTDPEMIRLAQTFGAKKQQILTKIVLPANIPTIISSLKVSVGMSWVGVIVGEFLISRAGLGYLIVYGSQVFQLDLVMASVVILSVVATLMFFCIQCIERLLLAKRGSR